MKEMYETGEYELKNPSWHEEDAPWKARQIERMIKKHKLPLESVCEVGCGSGEILLSLEHKFPSVTLSGYEISPQAFSRAKTKETENTRFYLGDIFKEEGVRYDVVLAIDVIEHVEDFLGFLKMMRKIGTFKILHIPLDLSVQSILRVKPILNLRKSVGHIHYFFKQTALASLEDCGYSIVDYCYTASRLELPNQAVSSRAMRIPRQLMYAVSPDLAVRLVGGYSLLVLAR